MFPPLKANIRRATKNVQVVLQHCCILEGEGGGGGVNKKVLYVEVPPWDQTP